MSRRRLTAPRRTRLLALALAAAALAAGFAAPPALARFTTRVVGGGTVPITQYPFQVALYYPSAGSQYDGQTCGGVIAQALDASHVITAAHCVQDDTTGQVLPPGALHVLAGTNHLRNQLDPPYGAGVKDIPVTSIAFDPLYDPAVNDYDVAVLTLASSLYTGTPMLDGMTSIAPIPFVTAAHSTAFANLDTGGGLVTVSGWGDTNAEPVSGTQNPSYPQDLQAADTHVVKNLDCRGDYEGNPPITPRLMCAGEQVAPFRDSCFGDSGGPLTVQADAAPGPKPHFDELVGLVDSGNGCAQPGFPGIYVNTANSDITGFVMSSPPPAPRQSTQTTINGTGKIGDTLTCGAGMWSGSPTFTYQFGSDPGDGSGGVALTGASLQNTYTVRPSDAGSQIFCEVRATNAGGYGFGDSNDLGIEVPSSTSTTVTSIVLVTDTARPSLKVISKSCVHRRCTVNAQVVDPSPSAGIREVQTALTYRAKGYCLRGRRAVRCTLTRTLHPRARSAGGGHFVMTTPRLKLRTTYRLALVAFDKAGNRQLRTTRLTLRVNHA